MALTERLAIVLETIGGSSVVRDFEKVGGAAGGLGTKIKSAGGSLKGMTGGVQGLLGAVGGLPGILTAGGAAIGGLVTFGVNAITTFNELALEVQNFQRASGATAEQSSAIVAALDDVGISAEVGSKAIFQLGKRLETSGDKLAGFGITAVRGADGNTDLAATLLRVADAYKNTTDPATRAALLTESFGKTGQQLIPILEQGRAGIEALYAEAGRTGQILSQDDLNKAQEYRFAIDALGDSMREVSLNAGQALIPAVTNIANAMALVIEKLNDIGQTKAFQLLEVPLGHLISPMGNLLKVSGDLFGLFDSGGDNSAKRLREWQQSTADQAEELTNLEKSTLAVSSAQRDYEASGRAVEKADRGLADARGDYNKLLKEGAVDEEKVADAIRSRDSALRSLGSAQRSQQKAQEEYNEALAYFNAVGGDTAADKLADARDNLADADDAVANAQDRATDANEDLAKAQAGDPEFNNKLADAKIRVKDAEQGVADATYTYSKNATDLNTALTNQNTLLGGNAAAVTTLYNQWSALIALKPELAAFLSGPLAALGVGGTPTMNSTSLHASREEREMARSGVSGMPASPTVTAREGGTSTVQRIGDVIINVKEAVPNPVNIAKQILWSLN